MTVVVSFVTPRSVGSIQVQAIGEARVRENITVPGSTTATLQAGEIVIVGNGESGMVAAAMGTTPDAAATASTSATSAGVPVGPGAVIALAPEIGEKINIKAVT